MIFDELSGIVTRQSGRRCLKFMVIDNLRFASYDFRKSLSTIRKRTALTSRLFIISWISNSYEETNHRAIETLLCLTTRRVFKPCGYRANSGGFKNYLCSCRRGLQLASANRRGCGGAGPRDSFLWPSFDNRAVTLTSCYLQLPWGLRMTYDI